MNQNSLIKFKFPSLFLGILCFSNLTHAQLATPNDAGLAYGHVHLNVSNIEEHIEIWTEHFDAEVITIGSEAALKFPNFIIMFDEQEPTMSSVETVMHHFGFKVRDIDKFISNWLGAGFDMDPLFVGAEGFTNAYVTLPGGVEVELQEDQGLYREFTGYHIHYSTAAYEELLGWYNEVFDLETQPRGIIPTTTNVPGMNMSFGDLYDGVSAASDGAAIDHVGFEIVNLEAYCQALEAKGIAFDQDYQWNDDLGFASAIITDPEGVKVELTEGLFNF